MRLLKLTLHEYQIHTKPHFQVDIISHFYLNVKKKDVIRIEGLLA